MTLLAKYSATPPTLSDGQRNELRANASGALLIAGDSGSPLPSGALTPRVVSDDYQTAGVTGAYTLGDLIGNSTTAASVVPINIPGVARAGGPGSGRIYGCRAIQSAASGTIVLPSFDLILFRPATDIPFAAGSFPADNAALNVSLAAMKQIVGIFSFLTGSWRNQLGAATAAGDHAYQEALPNSGRLFMPFNLSDLSATGLKAVMQAQSTANLGAVVNTFNFIFDVEQD